MLTATHYDILGVSPTASADDIKRAYRRLAMQYHPDHAGGDPAAELKFKEVQRAYDTVFDPDRRRAYDTFLADGGGDAGPIPPAAPAPEDEEPVPEPSVSDQIEFEKRRRRFRFRRNFVTVKRIVVAAFALFCLILFLMQWIEQRRASDQQEQFRQHSP